ncbi:MAG: archease [candidate division KSB1 bacterium]|nr:archease [candidate division KSB1 bacterium]MDZ7318095.1 archease [candidate division KSB1 bacterium]MDZ7342248.1 archease [candidate division KSB1 bacterium]
MNDSHATPKYTRLEHTGDVQIKVRGCSLPELFANSAYAMFDIITDASKITPQLSDIIEVSGMDLEELLVNWLSELNYLFVTESRVYCQFEIEHFSEHELSATVLGEKFNPHKHPFHTEIKAVTFHDLQVKKIKDQWETKIVFDI